MGVWSPAGKEGHWYFEFKYQGKRHTGRLKGLYTSKEAAQAAFEKVRTEIKHSVDQRVDQRVDQETGKRLQVTDPVNPEKNKIQDTHDKHLTLALQVDLALVVSLVESGVTVLTFKLMS